MSERQWKRWDVVARINAGKLTVELGARLVGLSERQMRRLRIRLGRGGRAALLHGNRGRAPANNVDAVTQARVLTLRQTKYAGFNDPHFAEKLATETPPVHLSAATVRRLLRTAAGRVSIGAGASARRRPA